MTVLTMLGLAVAFCALAGLFSGRFSVRTWSALFAFSEAVYTLDGAIHYSIPETVISPFLCAAFVYLWWWRDRPHSPGGRGRRRRPKGADDPDLHREERGGLT